MVKIIIALILLVAPIRFADSHSTGQSLEKEINGYVIDVGYSALEKINTGDTIRFDFNLWESGRVNVANFDHVWIRIAPNERGLSFASFLYYPKPLLTGMSYVFEKSGQYELTVRFLDKDDKIVAEAAFPLEVFNESDPAFPTSVILGLLAGFSAGALAVYFVLKRK
jgi:hypothetical protein